MRIKEFIKNCKDFIVECMGYLTGKTAQHKKEQASKIEQEARQEFAAAWESFNSQVQSTKQALEALANQRLSISQEVLPRMVDFCQKYMTVDKVNIKALMPSDMEYPQVEMEKIRVEKVEVGKTLSRGAMAGVMGAAASWALKITASSGGLATIIIAPVAAAGIIANNKSADHMLTRAEEIAADVAVKIEKMQVMTVELQMVISRSEELKITTGTVVNQAEKEIRDCEQCSAKLHSLKRQLKELKYKKTAADSLKIEECHKLSEQSRLLLSSLQLKADKLLAVKKPIIRWFCQLLYFILYKWRIDGLNHKLDFYQSAIKLRQQEQELTDERNNYLVKIVLLIKSIHKLIRIPVLNESGKAGSKTQDEEIIIQNLQGGMVHGEQTAPNHKRS